MNDKINRTHEFVRPVYMERLASKMKTCEAAKMIGMSSSTYSKSLNENTTRKVNEYAAELIYKKNFGDDELNQTTALITGSTHIIKTVTELLKNTGGTITIINK